MVKSRNQNNSHSLKNQGDNSYRARANKINASTGYEYCNELLSPFGELQGLENFFDLVEFREIFGKFYKCPSRRPALEGRQDGENCFRYNINRLHGLTSAPSSFFPLLFFLFFKPNFPTKMACVLEFINICS